ncbi:MAG: hypothetical protein PHF57_11170 [Methanoregula sp.]|jgi:hypothetical protein|nr:hypothetical protein [Methanoregula sp.]
MSGLDGFYCIYCLAPHPKVTSSRKKTAGIRQILIGTVEETTVIPPIVECPVCNKKYLLISEKANASFNTSFIRSLKLSADCVGLFQRYQLTVQDLYDGMRGISKVQWIEDSVLNRFKPINSKENHFHLVFAKEEDVYFIDITKNTEGESLGTNLEKVLL